MIDRREGWGDCRNAEDNAYEPKVILARTHCRPIREVEEGLRPGLTTDRGDCSILGQ